MSWLLFMDESGHDHKTAPYEVRGGVAMHASQLWPFIQAMQRLELDYFGCQLTLYKKELKGSTLLDRKRFRFANQDALMEDEARRKHCRAFLTKGPQKKTPARSEFSAYGQAFLEMVIQGRVYALVVVEGEVTGQTHLQCARRRVIVKVEVLVLHRSPQALHKHVVHPTAATIHADRHAGRLQTIGERRRRVLHALVGVENLRRAAGQSLLQGPQAKQPVERVRQSPRQHVAAVPIHDHCQVHPAVRHGHVGDVARPHLVGPHNGHIPQQIWANPMLGVVPRKVIGYYEKRPLIEAFHNRLPG